MTELVVLGMVVHQSQFLGEAIYISCDFTKLSMLREIANEVAENEQVDNIKVENIYVANTIDEVLNIIDSMNDKHIAFFIESSSLYEKDDAKYNSCPDDLVKVFKDRYESGKYQHSYTVIIPSLDNKIIQEMQNKQQS